MFDLSNYGTGKLKIIIGAGEQSYEGWIPTHKEQLDLNSEEFWLKSFEKRKASIFYVSMFGSI